VPESPKAEYVNPPTTPPDNRVDRPRLALGTAQLGANYGRIVCERAPDHAGALALLDMAWELGFRCIDTAKAYGDSERRIGDWIATRSYAPAIVTKLRLDSDNRIRANVAVGGAIEASRTALGGAEIETLLLHRAIDMKQDGAVEALRRAESNGAIGRWGVSVYSPHEFASALELRGIGAIEAPVNALDRRLERSGLLELAKQRGVPVIARSVFLQGALIAPYEKTPRSIPHLRQAVEAFSKQATSKGVHVGTLAIAAVATMPGIETIVLGAASVEQVREITNWARSAFEMGQSPAPLAETALLDVQALDPRAWPI